MSFYLVESSKQGKSTRQHLQAPDGKTAAAIVRAHLKPGQRITGVYVQIKDGDYETEGDQ
jgi:hypothetical protein